MRLPKRSPITIRASIRPTWAVQFLTLAATKSNRLYSLDEAERFARMALAGARAQKADRMDAEIATILIELARALILKSKMFDVTLLLELEIDGIKALGDILQVPLPLDYYAAALFELHPVRLTPA